MNNEVISEDIGFQVITDLMQVQLNKMCSTGHLFVSTVPGHVLWTLYLDSFEDGQDPVFRDPESSEHNCNSCNNFIRRYGNIIALSPNYEIMTLFDIDLDETSEFYNSFKNMSAHIKANGIKDVFVETYNMLRSLPYESCNKTQDTYLLGIEKNIKRYTKEEAEMYGVVKPNELRTFHHFHLDIPRGMINFSNDSAEKIAAVQRDKYDVLLRTVKEIDVSSLELIIDLINQGSLLDGNTHLASVKGMKNLLESILILAEKHNVDFITRKAAVQVTEREAKFKNTLVGVLASEISSGVDLNEACKNWNKRVDPANYMKATAPITKKQIEDAKAFIQENGYEESFARRFAVLDDIRVSEILHSNVGDGEIKPVSIFDTVTPSKKADLKIDFDKIDEVPIDKFMKDILPECSSIELYMENKHVKNLVALTTADEVKNPIFKWDNNYSWTYKGNLAGKSQLAEQVVAKGGRVDGVFRFTHSWNKLEPNQSLMDLHVFMPDCTVPSSGGGPKVTGRRVGWNNRKDMLSGGVQDVDYTEAAPSGYVPVENITFPFLDKMPEGKYVCKIHNWSFRVTGGIGEAEIQINDEVYTYTYPRTRHHQWITVAEVTLKDGQFTINHVLTPHNASRKEYGLDTNNFHKVNLICLSPNHWGDNEVGNKHYFFTLDGCKTDEPIRSFHIENLRPDVAQHRKVLEVLGNTQMLEPAEKQLCGLGFNSTIKDDVVLKCSGSFTRMIKVTF